MVAQPDISPFKKQFTAAVCAKIVVKSWQIKFEIDICTYKPSELTKFETSETSELTKFVWGIIELLQILYFVFAFRNADNDFADVIRVPETGIVNDVSE